jgi:hypothetical protein
MTAWGAFFALCVNKAPRPRRAVLAMAAVIAVAAGTANAAPMPPSGLEVQGGEDAWHPDRSFRLRWRNPAGAAAVHYRVRDQLGAIVVAERRIGWAAAEIDVQVPLLPGAYTADVWLEDPAGEQGPAAEAKLRFDDTRPAAVEPLPAATWVSRTAFPLTIRLTHPAGTVPPSGLRGYAVSIDGAPGGEPCAAAERCSDDETDLHGAGNDSFSIADLPEGAGYVHAVAVSGAGIRSATTGNAAIRVDKTDPVVRLSGAPPGWSNRPLTLVATAIDGGSGMQPGGGGSPFTAIRVDGDRPVVAAGDSVSANLFAEGTHSVAYYARDLAGNVDDGGSANGIPDAEPGTAAVRIDRTPPRVSFADSQDPLEPESIRARIGDSLSGPDPSRGWIGIRRAGSGDAFVPLPATPAGAGELRAHWDSDSYPTGDYEFEAVGYDLAGNATAASRRADGAPMTLADPLKTPTAVRAAFGGTSLAQWHCSRQGGRRRCRRQAINELGLRPPQRTIPFGRRILVSGRLQDGAGSPLGGRRPLQVTESFAAGSPPSRTSTVSTDASGAFAFRLPPGPSREIRVAFAGSPTLTRSGSRPLDLRVRSVVTLHASATVARIGGDPLVFRGQVGAAPGTIPATGKSVELQFRLPGLPWSEFRTVQTDRRGRFRYAYRFSDDDSRGVRFQFRAHVPPQDGWPYEPGRSPPVLVRGA